MGEVMTLSEIETSYPSEWVLVVDPELDKELRVVRGRVLVHSKDRDEVGRKAIQLRPKSSAYLYTGEAPRDMEILL